MKETVIRKISHHLKVDARYFLSGGFWGIVSQGISVAGGLIVSVLFAHTLSETNFGTYKYIIGIGGLLSAFALTGIGQSVFQTAANKYFSFYRESIGINFKYSLGISLVSFLGAGYYFFMSNTTLAIGCFLIGIFQPLLNTFQNTSAFLVGSKRFKEASYVETIKTTIVSTFSVITILITQNILFLVFTYLFLNSIASIVTYYIYSNTTLSEKTPAEIFQKYLAYAKNVSLQNIISNVAFRLDIIIIFQYLGATELAIYSIANLIPEQIKGSLKQFSQLILPKYANHSNLDEAQKNIPLRSFQLFAIFTFISITYIIIAPSIFHILFPRYESAIIYTQIIALSFPAAISMLPNALLQNELNKQSLFKINLISSIILIVSTLILTYIFGVLGAIYAKITYRYFITVVTYSIWSRRI